MNNTEHVGGFFFVPFLSCNMDVSPQQEQQQEQQPPPTSENTINLSRVIMVLAIIINVLILLTGIIGAIVAAPALGGLSAYPTVQYTNPGWALFFFSLGLIFFAILGILCELHAVVTIRVYIQAVGVFARYWTRAIWYVVMAFLALGVAGAMGLATAICCWLLAAILLLIELLVHTRTI